MSRSAKEEWELLNKAVNCQHYIGAIRWKTIDDFLNAPIEETKKATKPLKAVKKASK